jgi:hypothetical protein
VPAVNQVTYSSTLQSGGFSKAESAEFSGILVDWFVTEKLLKILGLSVDKSDMKAFLIGAHAFLFSNRRLRTDLDKDFNTALAKATSTHEA